MSSHDYWIIIILVYCKFVYIILAGVTHNIPVLRDIITHPRFISGDISTNFIKEVYPNGFPGKEHVHIIWYTKETITCKDMSYYILGRQLNEDETMELIAATCLMYLRREQNSSQFLNQDRLLLLMFTIC